MEETSAVTTTQIPIRRAANDARTALPGNDLEEEEDQERCEQCHDLGYVFPEDGYYQYLGDGTIRCPQCGGLR